MNYFLFFFYDYLMDNKDIAALESIEKLVNYNSYIFSKLLKFTKVKTPKKI